MFKPDSKLTIENLEDFLNYHKEQPLPEWFPTVELKDHEFTLDKNGYSLVTHIKTEDYINQGLTILPYIKGQLSYIEAGDIVSSAILLLDVPWLHSNFPRNQINNMLAILPLVMVLPKIICIINL